MTTISTIEFLTNICCYFNAFILFLAFAILDGYTNVAESRFTILSDGFIILYSLKSFFNLQNSNSTIKQPIKIAFPNGQILQLTTEPFTSIIE